jgi:hypothetical protein
MVPSAAAPPAPPLSWSGSSWTTNRSFATMSLATLAEAVWFTQGY